MPAGIGLATDNTSNRQTTPICRAISPISAPKVSGYITDSFVIDNQAVKAGQLLAKIDDRDFIAARDKADANLAVNQAAISNLTAQQQLQKTLIRQSESQIASASAEYERAQQQVNRTRSLLKRNYSSQDELDSTTSHLKVTKAQLDEASASYQAAKDQLAVIASQIVQAEASVGEAMFNLNRHNSISAIPTFMRLLTVLSANAAYESAYMCNLACR